MYSQEYVQVKSKKGDGIFSLLRKYHLPEEENYLNKFKELNKTSLTEKGEIFADRNYNLPILIYNFNGKTIRSTIGISNYELAKEIQDYNFEIVNSKLKSSNFKNDKILWVPFHYLDKETLTNFEKENSKHPKSEEGFVPVLSDDKLDEEYNVITSKTIPPVFGNALFGPKYSKIHKIDSRLKGLVFYLDPGHGGPDPGAIGYKEEHELTEDEYAYDITLRLAQNLRRHGATVYLTIIDSNNFIRDENFLKNNTNEYFGNGKLITGGARERLQSRIDYISTISPKVKLNKQRLIVIHVDSRQVEKRIDVFFYYKPGCEKSKKYAVNLMNVFDKKYNANQPGRGYEGNVSERNLFMLNYSPVLAVYLELGNIQNPLDQIRFLDPNNRQALANWICNGILFNEK
ncbi:MAG: hypothetical protein A2X64_06660 [Ignavibacteria bacterium GWF2_33_9]|nr:MAG: hypothetical protein A2X64_06660 [Ignavibacteria bacterium GWF2_33_9]